MVFLGDILQESPLEVSLKDINLGLDKPYISNDTLRSKIRRRVIQILYLIGFLGVLPRSHSKRTTFRDKYLGRDNDTLRSKIRLVDEKLLKCIFCVTL